MLQPPTDLRELTQGRQSLQATQMCDCSNNIIEIIPSDSRKGIMQPVQPKMQADDKKHIGSRKNVL